GHLVLSAEHYDFSPIRTFKSLNDRGFYLQRARVTNPAFISAAATPNVPTNVIAPYVIPTNWNNTGMIVAPGTTIDRLVFNPNGTTSFLPLTLPSKPNPYDDACECEALPTHTYGVNTADEVAVGNKRTSYFLRYEHQLTDNLKVYGQVIA